MNTDYMFFRELNNSKPHYIITVVSKGGTHTVHTDERPIVTNDSIKITSGDNVMFFKLSIVDFYSVEKN